MGCERRPTGRLVWAAMVLSLLIGGSLSDVAFSDPAADYTAIQRAFLREDFEGVTSLAPAFLQQHPEAPDIPRVSLWLALSLDRLQRSQEALSQLELLKVRLAPNDPLWPELLFWEADISRVSLQTIHAKLAYQRLLEQYPNSMWTSQALLGLGLIHVRQQAVDTALQCFHEVVVRQTGTPVALQALLLEGFCHLRLRHFSDAVAVFEPLLGQLHDPGAVGQAAFYLGESLGGVGRYEDAARAYARAVSSARQPPLPDDARQGGALPGTGQSPYHMGTGQVGTPQWSQLSLFGLGWADYKIGRCEESLEAFDQYLLQGPGTEHSTEALFAEGSCLMRLGKEAEGLQRFEEIVSRDPDHPLALESGLIVVDAYRKQERFDLAKELLHLLLRHHTDPLSLAQIQLPLGAVALGQGNAAQAKTVFELAAQSDRPSIRQAARNGLGDVELFLGHPLEARQFYDEAIRLDAGTPLAAYATYQVGRVHLKLGELDEAASIFARLTTNADPALVDDARLALAIAYLNQRQTDAARSLLETVRNSKPASPLAGRAAYYQALLALGEDREEDVRARCQEAIALAPRSDEAFEARLLLVDLDTKDLPSRDVMDRLEQLYASGPFNRSQRAKLAKRLGDLARNEHAYPQAIEWYQEAMRFLPSLSGEAEYRIASCYEETGKIEEATSWYQRVDQPPWRVRGLLAAAKLLERQDRMREAEAIYEALAHEPIPEAKVVQERLATLREDSLGTR